MDCHQHDEKWIKEQLRALPPTLQIKVMEKYSALYRETENRRKCNTRLREFIARHLGK